MGCYLVNRFALGEKAFNRAQDIFKFAALAGLVSTSVSATFGVASLSLGGLAHWSEFGTIWSTWWLGDAGGALVVAPLLVLWLRGPRIHWTGAQLAEAVILLTGILLIGQSVFGGFLPSSTRNYPLEFLCIPFLIWAAFRFGPRETAAAAFVIAAIAISGTLAGFGPFVRGTKNESLILLQVYVGILAVTGLALAALVSERKEIEEKLQHLAASDPLTGLANYRRFMEVLTEEISRSQRTGRPFAVLLLDLDGMKQINDRHGHLAGNQVLSRLSKVLLSCRRNIDTATRFGGDEFAMLLLDTDGTAAQQVAGRVFKGIAADPEEPRMTVAIGIGAYPSDGGTIESLLEAADRALHQMKRGGGGTVTAESLS